MKNLTAFRETSGWKTFLSVVVSLTFMVVWLPFLRAIFDGKSYHWGSEFFGHMFYGAGVTLDFVYIIIQLVFYGFLMYSFYWVRNRKVFYGMLGLWWVLVFGNLLVDIIVNGGAMFHGDTLNVHISITWIVVPLSILALALIYKVVRQDMDSEEVHIPWNSKNRNLMFIILGPVVIQAVLFAIGEPHGITDQIGVVMSIIQSYLIPVFLRPRKTVAYSQAAV